MNKEGKNERCQDKIMKLAMAHVSIGSFEFIFVINHQQTLICIVYLVSISPSVSLPVLKTKSRPKCHSQLSKQCHQNEKH